MAQQLRYQILKIKEILGEAKASKTSASNARAELNGFYDSLNNLMIKLVVGKYQCGEKTVFLEKEERLVKVELESGEIDNLLAPIVI